MRSNFRRALRLTFAGAAGGLLCLAIPASGHASTITLCLNRRGVIKGINVACQPPLVTLTWDGNGIQGPQGPSGPQGPIGPVGIQGAQGPTGAQGPVGPAGAAGAAGAVGPTGPTGDTGPTGAQGLIGNTGLKGPTGDPGPQGLTGLNGPNGTNIQVLTGGNLGADTAIDHSNQLGGDQALYLGPGNGADTSLASVAVPVSAGTLKHLLIRTDMNPGSSGPTTNSYTFSVCVNATCTTGLTCVITDPNTSCSDTTDVVSVNDGDLFSIYAQPSGPSANNADVTFSLEHIVTQAAP
jgi:hypothetical protein